MYGKEIVTRFSTKIQSNLTFYTDSNGREMMERIRNFRWTYPYTGEEPQTANYYPVTSRITIKDEELQFSVLNDRAQGGSSLASGQLELMVESYRYSESTVMYFFVGPKKVCRRRSVRSRRSSQREGIWSGNRCQRTAFRHVSTYFWFYGSCGESNSSRKNFSSLGVPLQTNRRLGKNKAWGTTTTKQSNFELILFSHYSFQVFPDL